MNIPVSNLLGMLVDEKVIAILKTRLTPEQVADLVMERINPHWKMPTSAKASLGGVCERQIQRREKSGQ